MSVVRKMQDEEECDIPCEFVFKKSFVVKDYWFTVYAGQLGPDREKHIISALLRRIVETKHALAKNKTMQY